MDIRNFNISEGSYSLIIVSWVLNFFRKSEIDLIINNIKKGLKPNGIVYFTAFSTLDDYYIKNLINLVERKILYTLMIMIAIDIIMIIQMKF